MGKEGTGSRSRRKTTQRGWNKEERERLKLMKKKFWYRPGSDVVSNLPATPECRLLKDIRRIVEEESSILGLD